MVFNCQPRHKPRTLTEFLTAEINVIGNIHIEALTVTKLQMKAKMVAERKMWLDQKEGKTTDRMKDTDVAKSWPWYSVEIIQRNRDITWHRDSRCHFMWRCPHISQSVEERWTRQFRDWDFQEFFTIFF